jgi:hypothetical protein
MRLYRKTELGMLNETISALLRGLPEVGSIRPGRQPEGRASREMVLPRSPAVAFAGEAQLITAERDTVKLRIHPDDANSFLLDKPGTRYGLAAAYLDGEEGGSGKQIWMDGTKAIRLAMATGPVSAAGSLPRSEAFQQFSAELGVDNPAQLIRAWCAVKSRAELRDNAAAAGLFAHLLHRFEKWVQKHA